MNLLGWLDDRTGYKQLLHEALYENIPVMYFTLDEDGNVLSVNEYGVKHLGYTADELVGHSVLKVFVKDAQLRLNESGLHGGTALES